jgi:glutamine synthetase
MLYPADEVFDFVEQEDVKFIRLSFCDVYGKQKNISILPGELRRAFDHGISFDASAICGFGDTAHSDLLLFPNPSTLSILPWRPTHGKVVRMFCDIRYPDGTPFERDCRLILRRAADRAAERGLTVRFGPEFEFYLFKTDEDGEPTRIPLDRAGYMDVAPEDRGENVRREICLTLLDMGIQPESSHHEEGPGQNEIDFRYSDAMTAADNAMNFVTVVKTISARNGLYADFSPKPLEGESGNGLHINMSLESRDGANHTAAFMAGILEHIREITAFLNPTEASYKRLGEKKAPLYVTWSPENRSQLIRIPAAKGPYQRVELRSPDPMTNPYLAFALLIHAGLDGVERGLAPAEAVDVNLYTADASVTDRLPRLPGSLAEAREEARHSPLVQRVLPGFLG